MKKKLLLIPLAVLLIASLVACAAPEPAPAPATTVTAEPHAPAVVIMRASAFGSIAYTIGAALETLSAEHPWMRIKSIESPGGGSDIVQLFTRDDWSDSIICLSSLWDIYASTGIGGVVPEPSYPNAREMVRDLAIEASWRVFFVTLDPDIKTEQDLAGKRIGLGRIGQGAWGGLPTFGFEEVWPELGATLDYFGGPNDSAAALIDGKVDAAIMVALVSPDLSVVTETGPMINIIASGRDFYYVGFTEEGMAEYREAAPGWGDEAIMSAGTLTDQPEDFLTFAGVTTWSVLPDFPEELAYEWTKFYMSSSGELPEYHSQLEAISTPEYVFQGLNVDYLHPGAIRAYTEAGLLP